MTAKELRALVKAFPWDEWAKQLAPQLAQQYRDLVVTTGRARASKLGVSFDQDDPFVQAWMTEYVGERITQLTRTTQKDVIATVRRAFTDGKNLSVGELSDRILAAVRAKYEGYEAYRALRIARSESAIAYNNGDVLGAAQAGFGNVLVSDGTEFDEGCRRANGKIWSVTKALNNPIEHPNCERSFSPAVDDA